MLLYEIFIDTNGNNLPEYFKIEHFINLGLAQFIPFPLEFQEGLIMRYFSKDEEILIHVHDKKLFDTISTDFKGVEMVLSWANMDQKLIESIKRIKEWP